jgi:hypothetical protein
MVIWNATEDDRFRTENEVNKRAVSTLTLQLTVFPLVYFSIRRLFVFVGLLCIPHSGIVEPSLVIIAPYAKPYREPIIWPMLCAYTCIVRQTIRIVTL